MTETTTDAQTPDVLWQRAMDRVAENDRLRTEAHEALGQLEKDVKHMIVWRPDMEEYVAAIRRWMERCG